MNLKPAVMFEIVRLIDLQPPGETGYCMLVGMPPDGRMVSDLEEELAAQTSATLGLVDAKDATTADLLDQLGTKKDAVVLICGFDGWNEGEFASLDINRSRLETGCFLIFTVDLKTAGRFLGSAPNIRSFLGSNIFSVASDPSVMSAEEVADRLAQLRGYYGFSDAQVIDLAARRDLPAEPHFIEWLVLLERSELAR